MLEKIQWPWIIAFGSMIFTGSMSEAHTPGIWLIAGLGLTLALAGTAHYIAALVSDAVQSRSASSTEPIPPLV